jgi:hypothetical protein
MENLSETNKLLIAEKKKCRVTSEELERSLEDEASLRCYCKSLEADNIYLKAQQGAKDERLRREVDEREKCHTFIDSLLRSHLILLKKLEAVVFFCDQDVDMTHVPTSNVSTDYLDILLRDVKCAAASTSAGSSGLCGIGEHCTPGLQPKSIPQFSFVDFEVIMHKQQSIDFQLNEYLAKIRYDMLVTHVSVIMNCKCSYMCCDS